MSSPLFKAGAVSIDPYIQGDIAAGSTDSGNPIKIGGKASSSVPTAVSDGQRVNAYFDTNGYLYTQSLIQGNIAKGTTETGNPIKIGGHGFAVMPSAVSDGQRVTAYFDLNGRLHVVVDSLPASTMNTGQYLSATQTYTNGQSSPLLLDVNGNTKNSEQFAPQYEDNTAAVAAVAARPLAVSTYSWTLFQNLGANATLNIKSSTGNVFAVQMSNVSGSTRYLQLHNTATTPAGAAVPAWSSPAIPAGGSFVLDSAFWGMNGRNFTTGIAFACSTTEATYTAATATDHNTHIMYK